MQSDQHLAYASAAYSAYTNAHTATATAAAGLIGYAISESAGARELSEIGLNPGLHKSRVDELQIGAGSLRRGRSDEFLEARIIPQRIEHRIESKQRRSERPARSQRTSVRYRK